MVDPIGMQNVVLLAHEVARIQKAQEDGNQMQIRAFARAMDEQTKRAEEDVNETPQTEKDRIHKEKEKEQGKKKREDPKQGIQQKWEGEPVTVPPDEDTGRRIDVKA
ncbi:MAG TPA: hypothetical protein VLH40_09335 [Atribacteraceae bacterium]|nr:hypothetical protein [Atribacteraceae bacterium]